MSRTSILTGALLALALGGLGWFVARDGGSAERASGAARPTSAGGPTAAGGRPGPRLVADDGAETDASQAAGADTAASGRGRTTVPVDPSAGPPAPAPARLQGELRGEGGPIRGAQVRLALGTETIDTTQSNADGLFTLRTPELAGGLELAVQARGYAPYERELRRLLPGESRNLGLLSLARGRLLDVDVTDGAGRPVSAAAVLVVSGPGGGSTYRHETTSGPQGRARFPDAPLGSLRIEVRAEGLGTRGVEHEHDGSGRPLRVALVEQKELSLVVRSGADGSPVAGASVTLSAASALGEVHEGRTDADGRVTFDGLGAERFDARILAPGFRTDSRRGLEANGGEVVHELLPWPCIALEVRAPGGGPLPEGTVARALPDTGRAVLLRTPDDGRHAAVAVPADGQLELCDLRPGVYVVRVDAPGFAPTLSQPQRIRLDRDASLGTLVLRPGGGLLVQATAGGQPLEGARVELHAERPAPAALVNETPAFEAAVLARATTDADGAARFESLSAGSYVVLVRAAGHQARLGGPVEVADGAEASVGPVQLAPGTVVRGRVRTPGGAPLAGALVVLRGVTAEAPVQLSTDAQGRFASPPLAPGAWNVVARSLDQASAATVEQQVVLGGDEEPEPLELVLGG